MYMEMDRLLKAGWLVVASLLKPVIKVIYIMYSAKI